MSLAYVVEPFFLKLLRVRWQARPVASLRAIAVARQTYAQTCWDALNSSTQSNIQASFTSGSVGEGTYA